MPRFVCLVFALLCAGASPVLAQPAPAPPTDTEAPALDPRLERALQIRTLLEGTLDVDVNARALFVLELSQLSDDEGLGRVLERMRAKPPEPPPRRRRTPPPKPELRTLSPGAALETALGEFFALEVEQREQLLRDHASRQEDAEVRAERDNAAELAAQHHADQLRAYLTETLDVTADPEPLFRFDLLGRLDTAEDSKLAIAHADLDLQRRRYLALSDTERDALAAVHAQRVTEAAEAAKAAQAAQAVPTTTGTEEGADDSAQHELEEALAEKERAAEEKKAAADVATDADAEAERKAAARAAAMEAARKADTEAKRILAEERARLLGVQEDQAKYEAALARRRVVRAEDHDRVLDWNLRVAALAESPKFESEIAAEADPMYTEIREDLDVLRERLAKDLKSLGSAGDDVPGVGAALDAELPADVDRGSLPTLRAEVALKEAQLSERAREQSWELAGQTRDDVVALNASRLRLLDLASVTLRRSVTSFGSDGVDQAKREFKQISLEVGFFLRSLPRHRAQFFDELLNSTVQVVIALLKLAAVIAAFVWWRRRGPEILQNLETSLRERRPMTRPVRFAVSTVWYLRRIRRPLVMLGVIWGLLYVIDGVRGIPNLHLVWIAARWVLLGLAAVCSSTRWQPAKRSTRRRNATTRPCAFTRCASSVPTSSRSALVLALSAAMVGRGAIYSWVLSTCWLLSFPVVIYLVHRWKRSSSSWSPNAPSKRASRAGSPRNGPG